MAENKILIEGIKVFRISREASEKFESIKSSVASGGIVPVLLELSDGDAKRILVVIEEKDGTTVNRQNIGKITKTENPEVYDNLCTLIKAGGYHACFYGEEGVCLLLRLNEAEKPKDLTTGFKLEKDVKTRVVEAVGEDGYKDRVEALSEHDIKEGSFLFNEVMKLIRKSDEEIPKPKAYKNLNKRAVSPIKKVLSNLVAGNNPILEGEKSLGKNVAWTYISWILNAKIVPLQCHERLTSADMLGFLSSDNTTKKGMTEAGFRAKLEAMNGGVWTDEAILYQLSADRSQSPELVFTNGPVVEALQRANEGFGTILLLDEMNLADGNLLSGVFNMLTDHSSDHIFVAGLGEVKIPEECLFIGATQNPANGSYSGVNTQNTATMSRFTLIEMPPVKDISPILQREADKWGVSEFVISKMNMVYNKFKEMSLDGEDSISADSLNIRGFESAIRLIGVGYKAKDAIIEGVINTVSDFEERTVLVQLLDNFIGKSGDFE